LEGLINLEIHLIREQQQFKEVVGVG